MNGVSIHSMPGTGQGTVLLCNSYQKIGIVVGILKFNDPLKNKINLMTHESLLSVQL